VWEWVSELGSGALQTMLKTFDNRTLEAFLGSSALFKDLPEEVLKESMNRLTVRQHPPDKLLLIEQDWGNSIYLILQGWVKVRTYNHEAKEVTLNILGPGDVFGEIAILLCSPRSADILSLTDVVIGSLPAADFTSLVQSEYLVGLALAKMMAKRLQQLTRRLRMRESDSVSRVVDILLFLAEGQGRSSPRGIEIPKTTHQEIAGLSGLSRETVSRAMSKLEKKGLIEHSSQNLLCLPNLQTLENLLS
jgi:CRP-like cAMP-binding protein